MKNKIIKGLVTALAIPLLFSSPAIAQPKQIALEETVQQESIDIFNYKNLTNVDLSRKTVVVDVYIDPKNPLKQKKEDTEHILNYIINFYTRMNVTLDARIVDEIDYSLFKKAEHIGVELLSPDCWEETVKQIFADANYFGIDPSKREATLKEDLDKRGLAILEKDVALVHCYEGRIARDIAYSLTHEIGHLFGLYHSYEFRDDPIPNTMTESTYDPITDGIKHGERFLNFMGPTNQGAGARLNFNEFQMEIVHSFLSNGLVRRQWEETGYVYYKYVKRIKEANNYNYEE